MIRNGSLTLNGLTDKDLIVVLEVKEKREGKMNFNPQQMQVVAPGNPPVSTYNNMVLNWSDHSGFDGVKEVLHRLSSDVPYVSHPPKA